MTCLLNNLASSELAKLIEQHRYMDAVNLVVDKESQRLKGQFRHDGNHYWYIVGDLYWKLGSYESALIAFRRSHKCWPDDAQALWAMGNCYDKLRRPYLAARCFTRALVIDPANDSLRFNLGNALFDLGKYVSAINEFKVIIQSNSILKDSAQRNLALAEKMLQEN